MCRGQPPRGSKARSEVLRHCADQMHIMTAEVQTKCFELMKSQQRSHRVPAQPQYAPTSAVLHLSGAPDEELLRLQRAEGSLVLLQLISEAGCTTRCEADKRAFDVAAERLPPNLPVLFARANAGAGREPVGLPGPHAPLSRNLVSRTGSHILRICTPTLLPTSRYRCDGRPALMTS